MTEQKKQKQHHFSLDCYDSVRCRCSENMKKIPEPPFRPPNPQYHAYNHNRTPTRSYPNSLTTERLEVRRMSQEDPADNTSALPMKTQNTEKKGQKCIARDAKSTRHINNLHDSQTYNSSVSTYRVSLLPLN